jgi:hypothetical protein
MKFKKKTKIKASILKVTSKWNKNVVLIVFGLFVGLVGTSIVNPGNIVQKSLSLVGIESQSAEYSQNELTDSVTNITDSDNAGEPTSNTDGDNTTTNTSNNVASTSKKETGRDSGSTSIITPEEYQAHADNGETKLIARQDWDVKINSRSPSACGTFSIPCSQSETAKVNISPYNTHTGELLPMTECNGNVNKPNYFSEATTTILIDSFHCEIAYTPSSSGMYRLGVELYLSTKVYTDTIYWGGYVWGTNSPNADGYFVN